MAQNTGSLIWNLIILAVTLWIPTQCRKGLKERPFNIGHRGSCGIYPEHTVVAYQQAVADGADMIECDITITKDLQLICRHENWLKRSTDVAQRPEFADKMSTKLVGGKNITDWFAVDFTLAELRQLRAVQVLSFRDQSFNDRYQIATLEEFVQVAQDAERDIGIYPEIKNPSFINSQDIIPEGTRFEDLVVHALEKYGYTSKQHGCILQSFEEQSLRYIREDRRSELPLAIMHDIYVDDATLDRWASMGLVAIGFWKNLVFQHYYNGSYKNRISTSTDLIEKIHARGLEAHVYTFRNEDEYLPWDDAQDPYKEYERYLEQEPDAYFTDFPATFKRFLDDIKGPKVTDNTATSVLSSVWSVLLNVLTVITACGIFSFY